MRTHHTFRRSLLALFFTTSLLSLLGEGSKNLTPAIEIGDFANGLNTYIGYLEHSAELPGFFFSSGNFLQADAPAEERVYIHIRSGETLYWGLRRIASNFQGSLDEDDENEDLTVVLYRNDETVASSWLLTDNDASFQSATLDTQQGVIADYASVMAGPLQIVGAGGYNALSYTNTTGEDQDFYIAFIQVDGGSTNPVDDVDARSWYDLWDFSVFNGTEEKPGRMFSQRWNFSTGAFTSQLSTEFQMYVRLPSEIDGMNSGSYVKELDMQGMEPFSLNIYANSLGANPAQVAGDFTVLRQSQAAEFALFEYDIFINNPDVDIYPTTVLPTVKITEAIFDCSGANGEAIINFTTNQVGQVAIILDLNGVGGYQAGTADVIIEDEVTNTGSYAVSWDGLDGLGVAVPSGTQINIRGRFTAGPLHVPFWDAEGNQQGIGMRDVRPATSFDLIYWDDSALIIPIGSDPDSQLTGTNVNTHTWGNGNNAYTNTWSFGYYQVNSQIVIFEYECDIDGDGVANDSDGDGDNDGISDELEGDGDYKLDTDIDGIPDYLDPDVVGFTDSNCDGVNDDFDTDLDGVPDGLDLDSDNDGIPDVVEVSLIDADNDGSVDSFSDVNVNGVADTYDLDCDGGTVNIYGEEQTNNGGVFSPENALGMPDSNFADLPGPGSELTIELQSPVSAGSLVSIFAEASFGDVDIDVSSSFDGLIFSSFQIFTIDDTFLEHQYFTTETTNFIRITYFSGMNPASVDAVQHTYSCLASTLPDSDLDGIPNFQDLDSDNDGITDAYEADGQAAANGSIFGFADTDGNGRNDTQDVGALTLTDTDGDGLSNYLDQDSDDDGILDNIEAQASNSTIPSEAEDDNMNGLLDVYDPTNGGTLLVPVDTDADENEDYIDDDSDGDSVLDIVEGHDSNFNGFADWDVTGDANNDVTEEAGYNTDADADGIQDLFDGSIAPLQNTDGADLADWQDADDDNDGIPTSGEDTNGNADWTDDFTQGGVNIPDYLFRGDRDGDGVGDLADLDSDNDGILDLDEDGGESIDPSGDQDLDGVPNYRDDSDTGVTDNIDEIDSNADGVWDNYDADLDGIPDFHDLDSDQDGILDAIEANSGAVPAGFNETTGQFTLDDPDGDGLMNAIDNAPADGLAGSSTLANGDADLDGLSDFLDIDADGDGITDFFESLIIAGTFSGLDEDGDGLDDAFDTSEGGSQIIPVNTDGADNPDYLDSDSDNDGVPDLIEGDDRNSDGFGQWDDSPEDGIANELASLEDADNDGLDDAFDTIVLGTGINAIGSNVDLQNTDGTGEVDYRDADDDNDGTPTSLEDNGDDIWTNDFTQGQALSSVPDYLFFGDFDGDGVLDIADLDSDNDGILDEVEGNGEPEPDPSADANGDNIPNFRDPIDPGLSDNTDSNGDGVYDVYDTDLDGIPDFRDADSDNDGIADIVESNGVDGTGDGHVDDDTDSDGDGLADVFDTDNDGTPLVIVDRDLDGLRDARDLDSDNDGLSDTEELRSNRVDLEVDDDGDGLGNLYDTDNMGSPIVLTDFDNDLIYDHHDRDSDNDGITDTVENGGIDSDGDGRVDGFSLDVNGNGLADSVDPEAGGTALNLVITDVSDLNFDARDLDTDNDGYPDIIEGGGTDANNDGIVDNLEDTNGDGIPDVVDATETVGGDDADGDGIDDFADTDLLGGLDTDLDCIPDIFDTDQTAGGDFDTDQILDIADVDQTGGTDIDGDNIDDSLDPDRDGDGIENAFDPDADGDGLDDETRNDPYFIDDFDGDGVANYQDLDSDGDGLVDVEEFGGLTSHSSGRVVEFITDANGNGWSDAQEAAPITPSNTDFANDPSGLANYLDLDADNDGIADNIEAQTNASYVAPTGSSFSNGMDLSYPAGSLLVAVNTDGTDVPDYLDDDSDNDNVPDLVEGSDANRDGFADQDLNEDDDLTDEAGYNVDVDDDGILDLYDNTVAVASQATGSNAAIQDSDLDGIWDFQDTDDDDDGIVTYDGSGADEDIDNDGDPTNDLVASGLFPDYLYAARDADGDGVLDDGTASRDLDADNDGLANVSEDGGTGVDPGLDADGDGLLNYEDADIDGDGILNIADGDGDGIAGNDTWDKSDSNSDGVIDAFDKDFDGIPDMLDRDSDNDGIADVLELNLTDADEDGQIDGWVEGPVVNGIDTNFDPAGVMVIDTDADGLANHLDLDSDNDGIVDNIEAFRFLVVAYVAPSEGDADSDGILDVYDEDEGASNAIAPFMDHYILTDSDADGILDVIEGFDSNHDGFGDWDTNGDNSTVGEFGANADSDSDGILDIFDTVILTSTNAIENVTGSNSVLQDSDSPVLASPDWKDSDDDGDGIATALEDVNGDSNWTNDFTQGGITVPNYLHSPDWDGDQIADNIDLDSDQDGILNTTEYVATTYDTGGDPFDDDDGDGIYNYLDISDTNHEDINADGVDDRVDQDLDGVPNFFDLDSDNDGILDGIEANNGVAPVGFNTTTGRFGVDNSGGSDDDTSNDGLNNAGAFLDNNLDGDLLNDYLDLDSDNDGLTDHFEGLTTLGYANPSGDDLDTDGLDDLFDASEGGTTVVPTNTDGDADPDYLDVDSDADGVVDFREGYDANRDGFGDWDTDGNNSPGDETGFLVDTDGDGLNNLFDGFTGFGLSNITGSLAALQDTDDDELLDFRDTDDDGDLLLTSAENGGNAIWTDDFTQGGGATPDYLYAASDRDGDGFSDALDLDSDNDGISDAIENTSGVDPFADSDGDGTFNYLDASTLVALGLTDSDVDGVADEFDFDLDGVPNFFDLDSDNDGITDHEEAGGTDDGSDENQGVLDTFVDTTPADGQDDDTSLTALNFDGDGQPNFLDLDSDNDGVQDIVEAGGSDSNIPADGYGDTPGDSDGDGLLNLFESTPLVIRDQDGDLLDNYLDADSDNDGIPDIVEAGGVDDDGDGVIGMLTDDNFNGWSDTYDGNALASPDTDSDGLLDAFDLDSDGDGIPDAAEANAGLFPAAITDFDGRYTYGGNDEDEDGLVNVVDTDDSGTALEVTAQTVTECQIFRIQIRMQMAHQTILKHSMMMKWILECHQMMR